MDSHNGLSHGHGSNANEAGTHHPFDSNNPDGAASQFTTTNTSDNVYPREDVFAHPDPPVPASASTLDAILKISHPVFGSIFALMFRDCRPSLSDADDVWKLAITKSVQRILQDVRPMTKKIITEHDILKAIERCITQVSNSKGERRSVTEARFHAARRANGVR